MNAYLQNILNQPSEEQLRQTAKRREREEGGKDRAHKVSPVWYA
jgi:hypothetical protein